MHNACSEGGYFLVCCQMLITRHKDVCLSVLFSVPVMITMSRIAAVSCLVLSSLQLRLIASTVIRFMDMVAEM
jgi:hypothetical protein